MIKACLILLLYPVISDIRKRKFYIEPVIVMSVVMAGIRIFFQRDTLFHIVMGCIPGIILLAICHITKEAIGKGDAYVVAGLGLLVGWEDVCYICLIGFLLCGMLGALLIVIKRANRKTALPFVPFLTAAVVILWAVRR